MSEHRVGRRPGARRVPLSRERIVTAAVKLADEQGQAGVTMRALARRLGVEAMSLYNHVAGREALLDGMVDAVFAEIELPAPGAPWRAAMRERALSARAALRRHGWAVGLMDSRENPGPATLRHHDAVLGCLRADGFSVRQAAHTVALIDSYVYGFVIQEVALPATDAEGLGDLATGLLSEEAAGRYPHLAETARELVLQSDYDFGDEFAVGLDLILGALPPDDGEGGKMLG